MKVKNIFHIGRCILISALIIMALPAWAANYYIAQSAAGSGNGSSCANARAYTWNWSGVTGDDTVWVCGTIANQVAIGASGTSGHPVTLKFCSVADCGSGNTGKFSAATPLATGFIYCGNNYITIDGNSVGIVEATNNGSSKGNKVYSGNGVYVTGSYVEIKNLTVRNLYVHDYQTATADYISPDTNGIYTRAAHDVKVYNSTVTNCGRGIIMLGVDGGTLSNFEVYNNTVSHNCWGIGTGTGAVTGNWLDNVKIHDNDLEMGANWVSLNGNDCHLNGFYSWSSGTGNGWGTTNLQIYNNYVHGPLTSPGGTFGSTAMVGFDGYGVTTGAKLYNNLVIAGPYYTSGNGLISLSHSSTPYPQVYNNTLVGNSYHPAHCINDDAPSTYRNNICVQGYSFNYNVGATPPDSDYNDIYDVTYVGIRGGPAYYSTLAAWRTVISGDAHSIITNPDLNTDYTQKSTSPTRGAGANLTSLGITALNFDKNSVARPSPGAWDIGAYDHGTGSNDPTLTISNPTLTVTKAGTGTGTVTSSPAGINCGSTCSANYGSGTGVTLSAASSGGSTFAGWGGACAGMGQCSVTMNAAKTVTATFTAPPTSSNYSLTILKSGAGTGYVTSPPSGISCGSTCSNDYTSGTVVTLTATPDSGETFTGWSGAGCSGTGSCAVTMNATKTVTANFGTPAVSGHWRLFILKSHRVGAVAGNGTVVSSPSGIDCGTTCQKDYTDNTEVTLTATPDPSNSFTGWSGGGCSGTGACILNVNDDTSVTASFTSNSSSGSGDSGGGGCFVATAAYGSYLDPHVYVLRNFRDRYLLTNSLGQAFVNSYYRYSPPLADFISKHETLKIATRWALTPVVSGVEHPYTAASILLMIPAVIVLALRRRTVKRSH